MCIEKRNDLVRSSTGITPIGVPSINESGQVGYEVKHKDSRGKVHNEFIPLEYYISQAYKVIYSSSQASYLHSPNMREVV